MRAIFCNIIIIVLFTGCSTLQIVVPLANVKSPEVIRKTQKQINFSYIQAKKIVSTDDASQRPPVFVNTVEGSLGLYNADFNYGLFDRVAVGALISSDIGFAFQTEYQFLAPQGEVGNGWASSVYFTGGFSSTSRSGDQKGTFGPGGYPWKGSMTMTSQNYGLSVGYRPNENWMTYLGYATNTFSTNTKIEQSVDTTGTDLGGTYTQNNTGRSKSLGLGFQFDFTRLHIKPVIHQTEFEYPNNSESATTVSLTLSVNN